MTLSSSLSAGVAGLQANATRLAVISDNIANSSTPGYRRADVDFSALVIPGSENTYSAGGVTARSFREVAASGTLVASSNATDLAISGQGFLPVTDVSAVDEPAASRPFKLVPTGGFQRNADGYLTTRSDLALMGWPTNGDGTLSTTVIRDSGADLQPIRVTPFLTNTEPTTAGDLVVNVPANDTTAGSAGAPYTTVIEYFDGVGASQQLSAVFTPTVPATGRSDTWTLEFFDSAGDPTVSIATIGLQFDSSRTGQGTLATVTPGAGTTYNAATGRAVINVDGGPIDFFIGGPGIPGGLTQIQSGFAPVAVSVNGAPAGRLASLEVDSDGFLRGVYDSGTSISLFRIPVVDVPNAQALKAEDGQAFSLTPEAGRPFLYDANTGPAGAVEGFALQESTVDVARELTGLIQTQRAYSSNATVVQTVDEMLQETTNLKR
ncbi:MAG: flagellar hook-basal body complex protein [Pseudomonadota bacterium]